MVWGRRSLPLMVTTWLAWCLHWNQAVPEAGVVDDVVPALQMKDPAPTLETDLKYSMFEPSKRDVPSHIYFINLDERTDRKTQMEELLGVTRFRYSRWSATKWSSYGELDAAADKDPNLAKMKPSQKMRAGIKEKRTCFIFSVFMSHLSLMKTIVAENPAGGDPEDTFLILEDDTKGFVNGWDVTLKDNLEHVPYDWDIIRLGTWGEARDDDAVNKEHGVYRAKQPFMQGHGQATRFWYGGMHAVLLRRKTLPNVIKRLSELAEH